MQMVFWGLKELMKQSDCLWSCEKIIEVIL